MKTKKRIEKPGRTKKGLKDIVGKDKGGGALDGKAAITTKVKSKTKGKTKGKTTEAIRMPN